MTHHIKGQGRHQVTLLPEVLDDFVTEDNPVKVIDVFVEELQLDTLGFERVNAKQTGRPGYHPATMLKLYIYGYLNRIQSSRRLEKEAHRNVELMWLTRPFLAVVIHCPNVPSGMDKRDAPWLIDNPCSKTVLTASALNSFE